MTGISLALDGSKNSLFRNDLGMELPTESNQADGELEDAEGDPFQDLDADSELED